MLKTQSELFQTKAKRLDTERGASTPIKLKPKFDWLFVFLFQLLIYFYHKLIIILFSSHKNNQQKIKWNHSNLIKLIKD